MGNNVTPISLYIHIPWCIRKCPYCDFNSHQIKLPNQINNVPIRSIDKDLQNRYINSLILDLKQSLDLLKTDAPFSSMSSRGWTAGSSMNENHKLDPAVQPRDDEKSKKVHVNTIFIGGGTPSLFSGQSINNLLTQINDILPIEKTAEITLEANPGSFEKQKFADFKSAGINRLSIGVQSFDNTCLKKLGRIHNSQQAIEALTTAKNLGFNFNIDLMHSLPGQTKEMALKDLQIALEIEPNHLSWYQLTIEPNTKFAKHTPVLPSIETQDDIFYHGLDYINNKNYSQYEISAFANNANFIANQAQHNLNYWRYGDYIGIGAGAHSKLTINTQIHRTWKQKSPTRYLDNKINKISGSSKLNSKDILLEYMMNKLRVLEPLSENDLIHHTKYSFSDINNILLQAKSNNWLQIQNNQLVITDLGRRFLNEIILLFV